MTARALRRVLAMDAGELKFRTAAAARRLIGRTITAAAPPRWRRERLARRLSGTHEALLIEARKALRKKDWFGAHELLGAHFASRRSAFPVDASDLDRVAHAVRTRFPGAANHARERASRVVSGRYDLLGYRGVPYGNDPDWHLDAISLRRVPAVFWADVAYLDPAYGDHKVTWELNRHQHWLQLGRAFKLTGDRAYYDRFIAELRSWLAANPPLVGTNWASMLELAFRSLSWLWAIQFFSPAASIRDPAPWMVDILVGIDRQLDHVSHNLSRYFSPNTHLTGEALALYVAGLSLPELRGSGRWRTLGRTVLLDQARSQIAGDGGHLELSGHYHRYSTDFYLLALRVARQSGDAAASAFERAAAAQAAYLRTICDDFGRRPATGDDDGGQLFPICGRPSEDCTDTLSTAAALLCDPALALGEPAEETFWLCGSDMPVQASEPAPWPSAVLRDTGYCVSRTSRSDYLLFDAGPHGYLNAGHAHADALSIVLTVAGTPLFIDPGTATYTMDPAVRDRFRSTAMHNTLTVNGRPQSLPNGPFHWTSCANARPHVALTGADCDYFEGTHDGYLPTVHTRGVLAVHGVAWLVVDFVAGETPVVADVHWHLHPAWRPAQVNAHAYELSHPSASTVHLVSSAPLESLDPGSSGGLTDVSLEYGRVEAGHTIRSSVRGVAPFAIMTAVDAAPAVKGTTHPDHLALTQVPGKGWCAAAFHLEIADIQIVLLASTESSGQTVGARSPDRLWGCDRLLTDARLACLITHSTGRREVLLVHGRRLVAPGHEALIDLPAPAQLVRTQLARTMQVTGGIL